MKGKDYIGKTLDELNISIDEFNIIADKEEINICDCCGVIESSYDLIWLEYDDSIIDEDYERLSNNGEYCAICQKCKEEKSYQIIYYDDEIEIHDKKGHILMWNEKEWQEDSQVVFSICNAIQRVCENKTIF